MELGRVGQPELVARTANAHAAHAYHYALFFVRRFPRPHAHHSHIKNDMTCHS